MNNIQKKLTTMASAVLLWISTSSIVGAQAGVIPVPESTSVVLENPLKVGSIAELLEAILNIVIVLATPIIVFFIIYSGFLYVTARGNAEQIKQASNALLYAVIGGVVIIGSVAIATIVKNLVAAF
jgi:Type IV secretion system pilin